MAEVSKRATIIQIYVFGQRLVDLVGACLLALIRAGIGLRRVESGV